MPAKTPRRRPATKRSRYSPEEIKAWRDRDTAIMDSSTQHLSDADAVAAFIHHATSGQVTARILSYSLRNQVLLEIQAEERGFKLTDVETGKGWRDRGRHIIEGETGLRLVKPITKKAKNDDQTGNDNEQNEPDDTGQDDADTDEAPKPKYRTTAVFDISQTADLPPQELPACDQCGSDRGENCRYECTCPRCGSPLPVEADDATAALWERLTEQTSKYDYTIRHDAAAQRVTVDHDARTVTTAADAAETADAATVASLAAALAQIIVRADHDAAERRAARKAARTATRTP